jgi:hypothetical protein
MCESDRRKKRFDLFMHGQDSFHLFKEDMACLAQQKGFQSTAWEPVSAISQKMLQPEDCS